jgi:hypothetical protein
MRTACVGLLAGVWLLFACGNGGRGEPAPGVDERSGDTGVPALRALHTLKGHEEFVRVVGFTADGRRLASTDSRTIRLWDTRSGKQVARFRLGDQFVHRLLVSPDGQTLACTCGDGLDIVLLDAASGRILRRLVGHKSSVFAAAFTPDGRTLVSTEHDNVVRLWQVSTGKQTRALTLAVVGDARWCRAYCLACAPDGQGVAVGVEDGTVRLLDLATGRERGRLEPERGVIRSVRSVAFSPDGTLLAAGLSMDNVVRVWDVAAGAPRHEFRWERAYLPGRGPGPGRTPETDPQRPEGVYALAFAPDGKTLAAACCDRRVRLWEVATGRLRHQFEEPTAVVAFAPRGPALATASLDDYGIRLWDWRGARPPRPRPLAPERLERAWADLGSADAAAGYRAVTALAAAPAQAVSLLRQRLQAVAAADRGELDRLIAELDDSDFPVRERASRRLEELGEAARPRLLRALGAPPSAEVRRRVGLLLRRLEGPPSGDRLRGLRAVEALEAVGGEEARAVLRALAGGAPGALQTEDAQAALGRWTLHRSPDV